MSDWTRVGRVDEIAPGTCKVVAVDGAQIAVFNLDGEFFALEDICPHDGSEIASGCIIGEDIECPRHAARFNIRTGEVTAPPAYEPIDTFPVRITDGAVEVRDDRWD